MKSHGFDSKGRRWAAHERIDYLTGAKHRGDGHGPSHYDLADRDKSLPPEFTATEPTTDFASKSGAAKSINDAASLQPGACPHRPNAPDGHYWFSQCPSCAEAARAAVP
jgi:hypothetical protein